MYGSLHLYKKYLSLLLSGKRKNQKLKKGE